MIGDQVKRARVAKGLSQEAVARLAGVQRKQLWKLESDRGVTLDTFRKVIVALEMPVVTFGDVEVLPGAVDSDRVLDAVETTIDALRNLAQILRAVRSIRADTATDEALARAAAVTLPPITAEDPTVRMLHALVDEIARGNRDPNREPNR